MTIRELIKELIQYDLNQEVEICFYTSIGHPDEMIIYDDLVDKNGNIPCQVRKEISFVDIEANNKTVFIG